MDILALRMYDIILPQIPPNLTPQLFHLYSYPIPPGVPTRNEAPPSELAVAVARHFESMEVDEEQVIGGFLSRLSAGQELGEARVAAAARAAGSVPPGAPGGPAAGGIASTVTPAPPAPKGCTRSTAADYSRNTAHFDGMAPTHLMRKRRRSKIAARPNEQVAAKVTRTDENGSWILANVQRFYTDTETYDVQDEDDTSKLIRLPWNHVMRLSMGNEGCFDRGARVMAIFPETTSFYRAVVSKTPVWKIQSGTNTPMIKELILKFEDDEDEHGRTPHRRVPSRYVIPLPQDYFYEDEDDVDLQPPGSMSP